LVVIMPVYSYKARDSKGKQVRGIAEAQNEIELAERLREGGYFVTSLKETEANAKKQNIATSVSSKRAGMSAKELLNFTIYLVTLIDSGIPLLSGLKDLADGSQKERARLVINDLVRRIERGSSLEEALSYHPHTFSKLYISIVGAGESTGKLSSSLRDLVSLLEWQIDLRAKVKEASTYPIILFTVMIAVVTLLVVKIIPIFEPMFAQLKVALPLPTRIVLGVSNFVRHYILLIIGLAVLSVLGYKFYNSFPRGRYRLDSFKLKIPVLGDLIRKISISRFSHTFSLALRSGVNVLTSLNIASQVTGNARIEEAIARAKDAVQVGEKLAPSLGRSGQFPPLVIRMIAVGEQTGALSETLDKVNEFYDKEVPSTIKTVFTFFEPVMIVVMGVVVGGIALSIFLPLFTLVRKIGG